METLNNYIHHPLNLGRQSADELELLREKYPYFQALHILVAKCHKNQNTFGYSKNLKMASLYAGDRKILFNFINYEGELSKSDFQEDPLDQVSEEIIIDDIINASAPEGIIVENEKNSEEAPITQSYEAVKKTIFEVVVNKKEPNKSEISEEDTLNSQGLIIEQAETDKALINKSDTEEAKELSSSVDISDEIIEQKESILIDLNPSSEIGISALEDEVLIEHVEEIESTISIENERSILEEIEANETLIESEGVNEIILDHTTNDEEDPAKNTSPEALDFESWLDNFTLNPPIAINYKSPNNSTEVENIEITSDLDDSFTKPLEIDEELEELVAKDHPVVLAEMAYDIQAFVKIPEEKNEIINEQADHNPVGVDDLLERFIHKNPKISRPKVEFYNPDNMARRSEELNVEIVSETLAILFYKQGHLHQSLGIYEKLILQNPDKKEIFATRINLIKEELINRL